MYYGRGGGGCILKRRQMETGRGSKRRESISEGERMREKERENERKRE